MALSALLVGLVSTRPDLRARVGTTAPKSPPTMPAAPGADALVMAEAQTRQADAFAAGLPSAHVIRLPGAVHRVWVSDEARVIQEMNAFMAALP